MLLIITDYKYRPRRRPKNLVKSPVSNGSHHNRSSTPNHNNNNDAKTLKFDHHTMKSSSPIHHSHSTGKYPFVPSLSFPSSQHAQQQFQSVHYPLVDPTLLNLDLHTRLQAMYAGVYYPWRFGPIIPMEKNPTNSPQISPKATTPPPLEIQDSTII